jgi:hypothetical protein
MAQVSTSSITAGPIVRTGRRESLEWNTGSKASRGKTQTGKLHQAHYTQRWSYSDLQGRCTFSASALMHDVGSFFPLTWRGPSDLLLVGSLLLHCRLRIFLHLSRVDYSAYRV